ncbi:MAG: transporter substrate-binding domain-containing protein [Lachnospira sp.]
MLLFKKFNRAVMPKTLVSVLLAIVLLFVLSGCSQKHTYQPITDTDNFDGRRIGVSLVWSADYLLSDRDDMTLVRYDGLANLIMALRYGHVDAIAIERPFATDVMNCVSGLRVVEPSAGTGELVACVNCERTDVLEEFNQFASSFYGSSTFTELYNRLNSDSYEYHKVEPIEGGKPLKVGLVTGYYPFCYIDSESGEFAGSEVEVVTRFANEYGYSIEFVDGIYSTIQMGIVNGEYDLAVGTFIENLRVDTELTGTVYLSQPYMQFEIVFIEVADPDNMKVLIPFDY